jgi:hypothetical protein
MRIRDLPAERREGDRGEDENDGREEDLEAGAPPPKRKRMSMTSMLRTKLSLFAEKN